MARKKNDTINRAGDLPVHSKSVSDFLDGKEKMLYGSAKEWARALLLFYRFLEDRDDVKLPEGTDPLDQLVNSARLLGSSTMVIRSGFDESVLPVMAMAGIDEDDARTLLDAIIDQNLKEVARDFDIEAGGLDGDAYPVRPANALRAIRSCMPCVEPMTTMSLPRSIAGIMAGACLALRDKESSKITMPSCENGDALLGLYDVAKDDELASSSVEASFYDGVGVSVAKMALAAAGHNASAVQAYKDDRTQSPVPESFGHAKSDIVIASSAPFEHKLILYRHEHGSKDIPKQRVHGPFTSPFPKNGEGIIRTEEAFVRYCAGLLSKDGVAALWLPTAYMRGSDARVLGKPLLEENLLHAVIEIRQPKESDERTSRPMSICILKRNRKKDEPVLLALLDGEGFDTYCDGPSNQLASLSDLSIANNPAAQKALELIVNRQPVDKCAALVPPSEMLSTDPLSLRFVDYSSHIDIAQSLARRKDGKSLLEAYRAEVEQGHLGDAAFLAALDKFNTLIGNTE